MLGEDEHLYVCVLHGRAAFVRADDPLGSVQLQHLRDKLLQILGALVIPKPAEVNEPVGRVGLEALKDACWEREDDRGGEQSEDAKQVKEVTLGTVRSEVSRLRKALPFEDALPAARNDVVALNRRRVFSDWWEVQDALSNAERQKDPYDRIYYLHKAEMAFVESYRMMKQEAPELLRKAKADPPDYLRDCIRLRWRNRRKLLKTLLLIGHIDRAITEYLIYEDSLRNDKDEFFEWASAVDLEQIGEDLTAEHGGQMHTLRQLAKGRTKIAINSAHRPTDNELRTLFDKRRKHPLKARETRNPSEIERGRETFVSLEWGDVDKLVERLLEKLEGFDPQVVVGIGRDGSAAATIVSHALSCRLQGWVAVSRYQWGAPGSPKQAHVRGAELPLVRASRVLVVDDLIFSGQSTRLAIDHPLQGVRAKYPDAEIRVGTLLKDKAHDLPSRESETWVCAFAYEISEHRIWIEFPWERSMRSWKISSEAPADDGGLPQSEMVASTA
jgi:hypoxanthine phosphoribosyltransferase